MYVTNDSDFTLPYEVIREEDLNEICPKAKDWILELYGTNWIIEKMRTLKFEGYETESTYVYLQEYENPENKFVVDDLSFINGITPVGTKQAGIIDNFWEEERKREIE